MTDERNAPQGFCKYGTPVPARKGDAPAFPTGDEETEELPAPRRDEGEGSRVPTGS